MEVRNFVSLVRNNFAHFYCKCTKRPTHTVLNSCFQTLLYLRMFFNHSFRDIKLLYRDSDVAEPLWTCCRLFGQLFYSHFLRTRFFQIKKIVISKHRAWTCVIIMIKRRNGLGCWKNTVVLLTAACLFVGFLLPCMGTQCSSCPLFKVSCYVKPTAVRPFICLSVHLSVY